MFIYSSMLVSWGEVGEFGRCSSACGNMRFSCKPSENRATKQMLNIESGWQASGRNICCHWRHRKTTCACKTSCTTVRDVCFFVLRCVQCSQFLPLPPPPRPGVCLVQRETQVLTRTPSFLPQRPISAVWNIILKASLPVKQLFDWSHFPLDWLLLTEWVNTFLLSSQALLAIAHIMAIDVWRTSSEMGTRWGFFGSTLYLLHQTDLFFSTLSFHSCLWHLKSCLLPSFFFLPVDIK